MQPPRELPLPPPYEPYWWEPLELGSLTDVLGLCLGVLVFAFTIWVARRQIQIMNRQTEMMHEQSEATKRQEALAIEQGDISKRQAQIAEMQHDIMREQMQKRPDVVMRVVEYEHKGRRYCQILFTNRGSVAAHAIDWFFVYMESTARAMKNFQLCIQHEHIPVPGGDGSKGGHVYRGHHSTPLFAGTELVVASFDRNEQYPQSDVVFRAALHWEGGRFPEGDEAGEITLVTGERGEDEADGSVDN